MRSLLIFIMAVACYSSSAFAQSAPAPEQDWYNPRVHVSVKIHNEHSATIQFACQTITVADWHADGNTMDGKVYNPGKPGQPATPERVIVVASPAGDHQLVLMVDGDRFTLTPGEGEELLCGPNPLDDVF